MARGVTGGTDYTYHADAQGSTRGITADGTVTDAVLYDAFGNTISRSGSTPTPVLYNGAAGYQSDSATGLQLLGHRYYDPSIGRFLSSDPAQAGTNWYDYCDNNPLVGKDPTGLIDLAGSGNGSEGGGYNYNGLQITPDMDCWDIAKGLYDLDGGAGDVVGIYPLTPGGMTDIGGGLMPMVPPTINVANLPPWPMHFVYRDSLGLIHDPMLLPAPLPEDEYWQKVWGGKKGLHTPNKPVEQPVEEDTDADEVMNLVPPDNYCDLGPADKAAVEATNEMEAVEPYNDGKGIGEE